MTALQLIYFLSRRLIEGRPSVYFEGLCSVTLATNCSGLMGMEGTHIKEGVHRVESAIEHTLAWILFQVPVLALHVVEDSLLRTDDVRLVKGAVILSI